MREDAYRANNRGVALLEQFRPADAAEAFRQALAKDPTLAIARVNLAIALFNVPDLAGAETEATAASKALPDAPQPHYILGLIARAQNRVEDGTAAFKKVLAIDATDVGAEVNLGQLLLQTRNYPEAVAAFRTAAAAEPYNATAVYNLGLALTRSGQAEEGQKMLERFRVLREGGYGTLIGQNYPDQGRYAEAVASTGAEADLVDPETPTARFADATRRALAAAPPGGEATPTAFGRRFVSTAEAWPALPGVVTLFDLDGDGALDLYAAGPQGQRLYHNEKGVFVDVTARYGLDPRQGAVGAVAGDYDNDEKPDLLVLRRGGIALLHNDGARFSEGNAAAGIEPDPRPYVAAAFVDADHDGDLDIVLGGLAESPGPAGGESFPEGFPGAATRLLQNTGGGHFKDVSAQAGVAAGPGHAVAVVPTDFDNRRDVDLLLVRADAPPQLFQNMRDGTFKDAAERVGLASAGGVRCAAAGDVNKDGFTDFFFGRAEGAGVLALSDGRGRFNLQPGPAGSEGAFAAQFLDYDRDGLLDLVLLTAKGPRLVRNLGRSWADVSAAAFPAGLAGAGAEPLAGASFAAADLDGDGDTDLVVRLSSGALRFWENQGGGANHSLGVRLAGLVSNRSAIGAKVEMRAGSLRQKLETYAATPPPAPADLVFGLGARLAADAVRVLWPAGILQTEMGGEEKKTAVLIVIKELDRKPSSCPYLYAWDGERFAFVTDFMGGGEMGYWEGPGEWNHPDPDEYVRLTDDQLRPRNGRYELRVTNELEEGLFVDHLALLAVAHPADVEVFPDEGLRTPPPPSRLYAARGARPPRAAIDDHGHDVLDRVSRLDRRYPDDFPLARVRGYAEEHVLTLDLGPDAPADALLLLTGWTDYAFSSDNVAAHQAGLSMQAPVLQVEAGGEWKTIAETGIPVGRPQTLVVDLAGKWRPGQRLRLATNMRVYWDWIRVAARAEAPRADGRLALRQADLRERGFSAEVSPDGREPFSYDYTRVSWDAPWKVMTGRYTRPGDVRELLAATDDLFVTSRPGDEIVLSFDGSALPPLPAGWRRTYLLYADGFSKEMDVNSARPDTLEPLPFHGMTGYPYGPGESFPMTPERRAVIERYDTRVVAVPLPPLELRVTSARGR